MSYLPRQQILSGLEGYGVRLICAEVIHDADLRDIWAMVEELEEEISTLEERIEDLSEDAGQEVLDDLQSEGGEG